MKWWANINKQEYWITMGNFLWRLSVANYKYNTGKYLHLIALTMVTDVFLILIILVFF